MDELFSDLIKVDRKRKIETAKIFSDAFMTDPLSCYMFSDEEKRVENLYNYFLFRVSYGIKYA